MQNNYQKDDNMSTNNNIYEQIGLTIDQANECHDFEPANELCDFTPPGDVLNMIINDNQLTIEQKIYVTWIYAITLKNREEYWKLQLSVW